MLVPISGNTNHHGFITGLTVGTGNTVPYDSSSKTVAVSIAGGGGGLGTAIK